MRLNSHETQYFSDLVRRKARCLTGRYEFQDVDCADIEQELALALLSRLSCYDPSRANVTTFLLNVIDNVVASLIRAKRALKRGIGRQYASDDMLDQVVDAQASDPARRFELRHDLDLVIAGLPPELQQICRLLKTNTMAETARLIGCSRTTLYVQRATIMKHMEDAGLRDYL